MIVCVVSCTLDFMKGINNAPIFPSEEADPGPGPAISPDPNPGWSTLCHPQTPNGGVTAVAIELHVDSVSLQSRTTLEGCRRGGRSRVTAWAGLALVSRAGSRRNGQI